MSAITSVSPLSIRLPSDKRTRLNRLAQAQDRTAHSLAIRALDEYIEREEARMAYEQQAIHAYENMQLTGQHVTQNELKLWVESLNSTKPKKAPECHK